MTSSLDNQVERVRAVIRGNRYLSDREVAVMWKSDI